MPPRVSDFLPDILTCYHPQTGLRPGLRDTPTESDLISQTRPCPQDRGETLRSLTPNLSPSLPRRVLDHPPYVPLDRPRRPRHHSRDPPRPPTCVCLRDGRASHGRLLLPRRGRVVEVVGDGRHLVTVACVEGTPLRTPRHAPDTAGPVREPVGVANPPCAPTAPRPWRRTSVGVRGHEGPGGVSGQTFDRVRTDTPNPPL